MRNSHVWTEKEDFHDCSLFRSFIVRIYGRLSRVVRASFVVCPEELKGNRHGTSSFAGEKSFSSLIFKAAFPQFSHHCPSCQSTISKSEVVQIEIAGEVPVVGQLGYCSRNQSQFVANVMQAVDTRNQVELPV